jgi:hypothetical protein
MPLRHSSLSWLVPGILTLALFGCAEIDKGLKQSADAIAPRDAITGKRLLNPESEQKEVARAMKQRDKILAAANQASVKFDTDEEMLGRLQVIAYRLAQVSHRPDLKWEVHLIEDDEPNAFTIGGGQIFFFRGLFAGLVDPDSDNEIAAVMAHEIGHVTARHISKAQGMSMASALSGKVRKSMGSKMYQASYTTQDENEADRISLLYMALAGFDPAASVALWERADRKYGSDPAAFHFTYDHALNADRARQNAELLPMAGKYFLGEGVMNTAYVDILASNDLLPKRAEATAESEGGDGSGVIAALSASLDNYSRHLDAKMEELKRQNEQLQAERLAAQAAPVQFTIQGTNNGLRGIFGKLRNAGTQPLAGATITVYYLNRVGKPIHSEPVSLTNLNLMPGRTADWSVYLKTVPGTTNLSAKTTSVNWQQ